MLVANELSKQYTVKVKSSFFSKSTIKKVNAVENVSLTIEHGQIVGLLGINGAGKTTTIKMLSTILEPTSGSLEIDGIDAISGHKRIKEKINLISGGERNLYLRLTAKENLEYFGALYGIDKKELSIRINDTLKLVGLDEGIDVPVERFSKGMKQRLQIARGLINNPSYIFLDEPTLGLDISIAREIREYVSKLAKKEKKGILLTTHYMREAEELCDYIYIIDQGKIILEGTKTQIKNKVNCTNEIEIKVDCNIKYAINLLSMTIKDIKIKDINIDLGTFKITSTKNLTGDVAKMLMENKINISEIKFQEPDLEDILFNILTKG